MARPFPRLALRFAWFDIRVGFFWDRRYRHLYICFLPMLPLIIRFAYRRRCGCSAPATYVCRRPDSVLFGDPLCKEHSGIDCSQVRLGHTAHVPLPACQYWYFEDAA